MKYINIKNKVRHVKASVIRQKILQDFNELHKLGKVLLTRKPMVKGTVYEFKNRCGKKNCRCRRGELHTRMALSYSEHGRTKLRYLKADEVRQYQWLTGNYRVFRLARAKLVKLVKEILSLANDLEEVMKHEKSTA
jgi:hypothetical protein